MECVICKKLSLRKYEKERGKPVINPDHLKVHSYRNALTMENSSKESKSEKTYASTTKEVDAMWLSFMQSSREINSSECSFL